MHNLYDIILMHCMTIDQWGDKQVSSIGTLDMYQDFGFLGERYILGF